MSSLHSRLRSRVVPIALVMASAVTAPALFTSSVHADEIDDQRAHVAAITDELERLEGESAVLAEELVVATDELTQLEADVSDAAESVADQEGEVADLTDDLGDVAVNAFMGGSTTLLGPMLGSTEDVNDEMQRAELSRVALTEGTTTSDDLERELNQLEADREELEELREQAEAKRAEVERKQAATEERTAEYQTAKTEAEAELGELIREEQERRARASELARQREAEAEAERQRQAQQAREAEQQQTQSAQPASTSSSSNTSTSSNSSNSSNNDQSAAVRTPDPAPEPAPAPAVPQASSLSGTAVNAALSQQGVAYRFAAASPGVAFDCSGLTSWAWGVAGVYLPHQSAQQYASLPKVPSSQAQPGDLLFFYSPISHVAMYIGNGMLVHAPNSGSVVHTRAVNWGSVVGVGRPG